MGRKEARLHYRDMVQISIERLVVSAVEEIQEKKGRGCHKRPLPEEIRNLNNLITKEWREQGIELRENGDHILELLKEDKVIARFAQTGVNVENLLKVRKEIIKERRN